MGKGGKIKDGKKESGFTLLELVIAMFLTVIVSTAIYMAYNSQHKSYTVQEQVSAMQQNLRAAMYYMQKDIRMAGSDPALKAGGGGQAGAEIVTANVAELEFTMDITGGQGDGIDNDKDGLVDENGEWFNGTLKDDSGERVNFRLDNDTNNDGIADSFPCNLGRETWSSGESPPNPSDSSGLQDIAENIETLNFVYLDADGNVTATMDDIRQIRVTITARSERPDTEFTSASGDNFRRRTLSMIITPRNIILK